MKTMIFERFEINEESLAADLQAALGTLTSGVSSGPSGVIVYLDDNTTPQQMAEARRIVENHDPAALTPRQQAEQLRQQKLTSLRQSRSTDLDPANYNGELESIQVLAEKIAWLEQEVLDLRAKG